MTTTPPLRQSAAQEAAFIEEVLNEWRDWRAYLQAQQSLLDARRTDQHDPFELNSVDEQEAHAQHALNRLPAGRRALFQQEHDRRRQQMALDLDADRRRNGLRGATDPDEVDVQTLVALLGECEGRSSADGRGMVPRADGTYWGLEVSDLLDAPPLDAYAIKGTVTPQQKLLLVGGMLAMVLGVGVVFWLLFFSGGGPIIATGPAPELVINEQPATPLALRAIDLGDGAPPRTLLPVPDPTPFPAGAAAAVRDDTAYPPLLCLDSGSLEAAQSVTLHSSGTHPARTYTLRPADTAGPIDLLLEPCDGIGSGRAGVLQKVTPPADSSIGHAVALPAPAEGSVTVTVQALDLIGPGHDLTLPADGARASVHVTADQPLDWPTLQPRLLLQTGAQVLPAATEAQATGGVVFHFLIDAPTAPLDAAFLLSSGDQVVRWRTALAPPPTRQAVLRTGLHLDDVQAEAGDVTGETLPLTVSVTLHNRLEQPLTLTPADLSVQQGDVPLPLPELTSLREPLAADGQRDLTLLLTVALDDAPLTLTIGGQRVTFTARVDGIRASGSE